jgi:hypothetical protein
MDERAALENRASEGSDVRANGLPQSNGGMTEGRGQLPLASRLSELSRLVPPPEIAEIWVFPPLAEVQESGEFFLFTRYLDDESRRLYSSRLLPTNGTPARQIVVEHGTVPADRVPRLVGRLQHRVGQPDTPRHVVIDGETGRWEELLAEACS